MFIGTHCIYDVWGMLSQRGEDGRIYESYIEIDREVQFMDTRFPSTEITFHAGLGVLDRCRLH